MINPEELEVLRTIGQTGGQAPIQVIKRLVLPYRPHVIDEIVSSLRNAGLVELTRYSGIVKLTEKGAKMLGKKPGIEEPGSSKEVRQR